MRFCCIRFGQTCIVGQFRSRRGIVFEVDFGSCKMCLPTSAWNDSILFKRVLLRVHDSEPYMRTGITQLSTRLLEESGLSCLWKTPSSPCEKKAAQALCILSSIEILLVGEKSLQTPRHFTAVSTGNWESPIVMQSWEIGVWVATAHLSRHKLSPRAFGEAIYCCCLLWDVLNRSKILPHTWCVSYWQLTNVTIRRLLPAALPMQNSLENLEPPCKIL